MPSTQKSLYFMGCAFITVVSVAILGVAMSQTWAQTSLECAANTTFNGQALITWDLFSGFYQRQNCPLLGSESKFQVFADLKDSGAPVVLCAVVIMLLVCCLICSACSFLIALYNAISNPYQTYLGARGLYVCSSLSVAVSVTALILYVVAVSATEMSETIVWRYAGGNDVKLRNKSADFKLGYMLVIPYAVLSAGAIVVVYLYDHLAYTQRREQQRPTEDAPKEIMMY